MSEITVIEANSKKEFIDKVNLKLQQGFKISSTNCGFVDSEQYDYCSVFQAILIKE